MAKILLVDDEPGWLQTLALIIKMGGHEPFTAEGAKEALALYDEHTIDLIISDIRMPGMNGEELLKEIRERDTQVGFMLMSAFATTEEMTRFKAPYLDLFFEKPIGDFEAFSALIDKILERVKARREAEKQRGSGFTVTSKEGSGFH